MKISSRFLVSILTVTSIVAAPASAAPAPTVPYQARPKLILLLVIDQFRSDYLMRFQSRFKPAGGARGEVGGFNYLMSRGAYYPFGEYDILQSMTAPGHATISTGSYPYQFGIPTNAWFDQTKKDWMYCTEDAAFETVGAPNVAHKGTSPKNLIGTTFGDELKNAGYKTRVVSIALKDRSAILMGGHRSDLSLWFEPAVGGWVSSKFYLPDGKLPDWVAGLNSALAKRKGEKLVWDYSGEGTGFTSPDTSMILENPYSLSTGKKFPHASEVGNRASVNLPFGLEITADAAGSAMKSYGLGRGKSTDVLAVSFSSHDYVGHSFGPNSREMEEMTVAADAAIARVLNAVRVGVPGGLQNVIVALTADHGSNNNPTYLNSVRMNAGRINMDKASAELDEHLAKRFGKADAKLGKWIPFAEDLGFAINHAIVAEKKLSPKEVEDEVKSVLARQPGAAHVFSASDVREQTALPPGMHRRQILKTFYKGRSPDVVIIPKPYFSAESATADHMTGYAYDRMVPIILAGFGIKPGRYAEKAEVVDIAPTLNFLAGSLPPALNEGRVLSEALAK